MAAGQLNTFLDRLLQYVPQDKQAEARTVYSQASDRATVLETTADRVTQTAQQQHTWWESNKDAVAERDRLRAAVANQPAGDAVNRNTIEEAVSRAKAETLEVALGLGTALVDIGTSHIQEFGEKINTADLARQAIAANKPIDVFYNEQVAARRTERATAARQAELDAVRKEGREEGAREVLARTGQGMPFPSPSAPVTTLSGLRKPADGTANPYSVEAAVQTAIGVMNQQGGQ